MNTQSLETLWVNLMNRSTEMLRMYVDPTQVDQTHLSETLVANPEKLTLIKQIESPMDVRLAYLACILTDACMVLDIIYSQHTGSSNNNLSMQCVELLFDLIGK
jgi:hypothetical protein